MKRRIQLVTLFICISFAGHTQNPLTKILKAGEKAVRNVGRTVEKGAQDLHKTTGIAAHDLGKTTGKAVDDARKTIEKGLLDASRESGRAGKNAVAETGRVKNNTVDLFKALGKYTETSISGTLTVAKSAEQRLREGKLLDAVFHIALDPLTKQEEAAFLATQQSKYLNTAGAVAASVYGGPGGAAAYAAWQTYRISGGNAELALRAGIIAGLTSSSLKVVGSMNGNEATEMLQKSVLAGTVGGLAIAASGGNEDQIKKGFILGGGMVLVQDLYRNYTQQTLDPSPATKEPYCTSPGPSCETLKAAFYTDENGNQVFDPSKLDPKASYVGVGADPNKPLKLGADIPWDSDQSVFMRSAAKVPGMNAMGLFHDKLVVSWAISDNIGNQLTIFPAMLFTYLGTDGGITTKIANVTAEQNVQQLPNNIEQSLNPSSQSIIRLQVPSQNTNSKLIDNQGNEFYPSNNLIFNRFGQPIDFDKLPLEIRNQITNLPSTTPPPADVMFDFSSPGTKLENLPKNIPCGFSGSADKFVPLPSIEYAIKYIENENWENYGMKNMLTSKHSTAPIGSIIYVRNIANGTLVRTYVIGTLSKNESKSGATIILSDPAFQQLGANGESLWVETDYEDIGVEKLVFKQGVSEKIAFDNLRNGKWQLRIFDDFRTLYTLEDYNNEFQINLAAGKYGFELVDISTMQTYRSYTGTFTVNE